MSKADNGHITPALSLPRADFLSRQISNAATALRAQLAHGRAPGRLWLSMLAEQLDRLAAEARYLRDDGVTIPVPPRAHVVLWDGRV